MDDTELLAKLIGQFESREEAEHVVTCDFCGPEDGGFYRCGENPVSIREEKERQARRQAQALIWVMQGASPPDPWKVKEQAAMREMMEQYTAMFNRSVQRRNEVMDAMFAGGTVTFPIVRG